ncbi:MAG TPA: right-handed parallel beta-helix repeat-containing protein, partial [Magnetospirillum sp.]|nr:right-handed parallel beta-helix repeat-containing protein [Magnetospirillum sp.]
VVGAGATALLRAPAYPAEDIRRFGAKGDGRHDDAAAIQKAIDSETPVLRFPAGTFRIGTPLRPRSGQSWRGEGGTHTVLAYGGDPAKPPFNMVHLRGAIQQFAIENMGFRGNRPAQTARSPDGQGGFAVYVRGDLRSVTLRGCRFEGFGDGGQGGGGVILGPTPGEAEQGLADITVQDCVFRNNGNVPGLYVSGGVSGKALRATVSITGNQFEGIAGSSKFQNAIYVLGEPGSRIGQVNVSHNTFEFLSPVDAAIELNWVENFVVAGNTIQFRNAQPFSSGILLRDGTKAGTVSANVITNTAPEKELRGVALLNFGTGGTIEDVVVASNTLSGVPHAIAADRGSRGILISGNRIAGSHDLGVTGIRIMDADGVIADGNLISAMRHALVIGAGSGDGSRTRAVHIANNVFTGCGGDRHALVALEGAPERLSDVVVRANRTIAPLPGTPAFADAALSSVAVVADNAIADLPAGG